MAYPRKLSRCLEVYRASGDSKHGNLEELPTTS